MRTTHRRYWVFFLLFLFSAIAYLDRVNMSVAGKPIAHEFGLSPIALGYLFSSFLWAYVLMMLPGGRLIDRWGPHVVASVAAAVWSTAQMATGMIGSFAAMLMVRLGLGVGEAPFAPISYSSVRLWSPYTERGTAIAAISCGSTLGLALGAPAVAWLIETLSWRWSFIITGAVGFVWVAVWAALISTPEKTGWLPPAERDHILAGRDAGITPPSHSGVGYLGLIRSPAMWGLFISQGCLVYTGYLYISWLPNYLQTARHLSILNSGIYTAIPFLISTVVGVVANWAGDRVLTAEAVRGGSRRYLVVLSLLFMAAGLAIPFVQSLAAVITLITIAVSAAHVGPAANGALVADLLRSPGDAGRATAFLVLGGNTFGLLAPIVTGYVVAATGSFNAAFVVAGALALVGAVAALALVRGTLGEHVRPSRQVHVSSVEGRGDVATGADRTHDPQRLSTISYAIRNPLTGQLAVTFPKVLRPQCRLSDARQTIGLFVGPCPQRSSRASPTRERRGADGYCGPTAAFAERILMKSCEANRVDYLFGLARNDWLAAEIAAELAQARAAFERTEKPARRFKDFTWSTLKSWSRSRRVVAKAE